MVFFILNLFYLLGDDPTRIRVGNEIDHPRKNAIGENLLPEVEIVSLLHVPTPKYKLRADDLIQYTGYLNQDFSANRCEGLIIQTPTLTAEQEAKVKGGLTPEQAEAALEYFVLCGDRLSQMTQTYNDVDAVTRLLQVM